ncbi:hypothetical protein CROQUDRAFT_654832 [Cronartium quercuum f. sp. fusiforme G11]|uniref:Beta-galactosidase n=1 Tax=Cronartium quercuum f. sp. fusiforme G11 TaxID=708437 RepID=A0A9P6NQS1_9BASI|nr:hypothetical protein CROQUDRAFT_654832 [Cronartium quercuum f. sp. fusiforme G11]
MKLNLRSVAFIGLSFASTISYSANVTSYALKQGPLDTDWTKTVGLNPWPEYPRPHSKRLVWLNLNGIWQLKIGQSSLDLDAPPFGGTGFNQEILVPFCVESALSGIMESHTHLWYRKTFKIPETWKGKKVLLNFGAVDYEATVFLNGQQITSHQGGFDKFSVELQNLKPTGEDNELLVFVYDPTDTGGTKVVGKQTLRPSHVFYTATTGIWQTVFLEPVPETYVTKINVNANMHGLVNITILDSKPNAHAPVKVTLHSPTESMQETSASQTPLLTATGTSNKPFVFQLQSPKLWSPATPILYNFTVQLGDDIVTSYLGFRTIEKKADSNGVVRPFLNGEFIFQFGPLDQGFWPDGMYTAPTHEAMEYDLKLIKKLGLNMLRKHVKVEPDLYYYACDRLGLLVWQDMPSLNLNPPPSIEDSAEFERQLYRIVSALSSFPCIVTWIIFNEGWGQTSGSPEIHLTEQVRLRDPSRLVMSVSGWNDHGAGDFLDNHHYSSPQCGVPFFSNPDLPYDPKRIGSQGEFGGIGQIPKLANLWKVDAAMKDINSTYEITDSIATWNYRALTVISELKDQVERYSCSAGVYTQTTDVEGEVNGFVTYDRRVVRTDVQQWNTMVASLYASAKARANSKQRPPQLVLGRDGHH